MKRVVAEYLPDKSIGIMPYTHTDPVTSWIGTTKPLYPLDIDFGIFYVIYPS